MNGKSDSARAHSFTAQTGNANNAISNSTSKQQQQLYYYYLALLPSGQIKAPLTPPLWLQSIVSVRVCAAG